MPTPSLTRNTLYNIAGQTIPILIGLAAIPITVHALGDARFGLLGLAWAILGYVGALDLGLGRATTQFVAQALTRGDSERLRRIATLSVASQTALGVAGGALLALLAPAIVALFGVATPLRAEAQGMVVALGLSIPFVMLAASLRAVLEAAQRFDLVNLIRAPASAAVFLVPAIAASLGARLPAIVLLLVAVRVATCIVSAAAIRRAIGGFRWELRLHWPTLRPLLGYGGWVTVSSVVGPALVYLERFMLAAIAGVAAVGYYTAPAEVAMRLLIVPAGLASALFPAVTSAGAPAVGRFVARPLRVLFLTLAPIVLLVALYAHPLLEQWLGARYAAQGAAALAILAVGVLINGLAHVPYAYLLGRGRPDLPAKFHLIELPLYAAAAWLLIGRFGITGAALAWTLRVSVDAALLGVAVWREQPLRRAAEDIPGQARLSPQHLQ